MAAAPILIAGGGIGGLGLALALARRGRRAIVLERKDSFDTAGAGIQLGPNGTRALHELGLRAALEPHVGKPAALEVFDGARGTTLARLPLGAWLAARHGTSYWVAHRGDLLSCLLAAVEEKRHTELLTAREVKAAHETSTGVIAVLASGERIAGSALVGADGLWSAVRTHLEPARKPVFAGATATRAVLAVDAVGSLATDVVGLWLGRGAHVVHYPVRGGRQLAVVLIAREAWESREWDASVDAAHVRPFLERFARPLVEVMARVATWRKWALHALPALPAWSRGRITLLGDAAHPVLPYLAQGGVMALEDALVLSKCLAAADADIAGALARYAARRQARAARVQVMSARAGRIYELKAPLAWGRDLALRLASPDWLMARYDWLYGWQP
jgi:salicylate hydroxylase